MRKPRYVLFVTVAFLGSLLALALTSQRATFSASPQQASAPTAPQHFIVAAGYGQDNWAANIYNPQKINIYVGDSITWVNRGRLEPHTISFGPMPLLRRLFKNLVVVSPQKGGPPQLSLNPLVGFPTRRISYNGTGFASSGFLAQGQRWTITFTRPGKYHYHCLIHFPEMFGVVVVHTRPSAALSYRVLTGYRRGTSAVDAFFPEVLTIRAGSTVTWYRAAFHTVTFASAATITQLRKHFIVPVPQKGGPPKLTLNPITAFPSGGRVYSGTGFLSSGILQPPRNVFSVTFTRPGVYHYGCLVHPGMDGTIRVIP